MRALDLYVHGYRARFGMGSLNKYRYARSFSLIVVVHDSHLKSTLVGSQAVRKITRTQKSIDKISLTCLGTKLRVNCPNLYDTLS